MSYLSQELEQLSQESGVAISQIDGLLGLVHAPRSLTRFRLVIDNLREVLRAGLALHDGLFGGLELELPVNVIDSLSQALAASGLASAESVAEWFDESAEPRGIIKESPEWAMLIFGRSNPLRENGEFLQHLYIALHCSIQQRQRHALVGSEIEKGCRVIRKLATKKIPHSTIFPITPGISLGDYLGLLHQQPAGVVEDWGGIELLVRKVIEENGKTRFSGGYRRSGNVVRRVERTDDDEHSPEGPAAEVHVYESYGDDKSRNRAKASGLHPGESEGLRATSVIYSPANPTAGFSIRDHVRRQASQITHISSLNQRLPFRYRQLTNVELAAASALPAALIRARRKARGKDLARRRLDDYVAVMLHMLLWLGRPLKQLFEMRVCETPDELPRTVDDLLAYVRESDVFVLPVPSPKWRRKLSENDRLLLETIGGASRVSDDHRLIVNSPSRFSRFIDFLSHNKGELGKNRKQLLFPRALQTEIVHRLKEVLRDENRKSNLRLTHLKISQAMFDEISTISTDWVDASLLTGQVFTTTEVSSHYYSVTGQYLQELYREAVVSLGSRLYQYLGVSDKEDYVFESDTVNDGRYGSKLIVEPQLVKTLVQHFKHQISDAKLRSFGVAPLHNALVTYIAFWILFSTGYRAVTDLIFRLREIDWETGFLVISDKDDDHQSNSRIVWLPPQLLEQIAFYIQHLEIVQAKVPPGSTVWRQIDQLRCAPQPDVPLLFLIRENDAISRLTPDTLRGEVEQFTLPINVGRHYLRTRLREAGCDAECVNAYLGHWQYGQEPFGTYSTLAPVEMMAEMAPYLESLRREAGWTPQRGFADG